MEKEFSCPVDVPLHEGGKESYSFSANKRELDALARRFQLKALSDFRFSVELLYNDDKSVQVTGKLDASVTQTCILTLMPVTSIIQKIFQVKYVRPDDDELSQGHDQEQVFDLGDMEIFTGQTIDLGELAAQYLSVYLDPYPKAEGASITDLNLKEGPLSGHEDAIESVGPFSVLKKLKDKG